MAVMHEISMYRAVRKSFLGFFVFISHIQIISCLCGKLDKISDGWWCPLSGQET